MAFEANPDGSTRRMFAKATGINAVWVIDWPKRQVVDLLWPPKLPLWRQNADGIQTGDMHGLEVLPDRSAVWASSRLDSRIYGWSLPDLKYIGAVEVGPSANWMTPTPDSRFMYVAISGSDHTLAVDLRKLEIVAKIKTGARPARISTASSPARPRQRRDDPCLEGRVGYGRPSIIVGVLPARGVDRDRGVRTARLERCNTRPPSPTIRVVPHVVSEPF